MAFDNLFTSHALLNHFSGYTIGGTGTLIANRTDHCPIKDLKVIGKEDCRSYDYKYDFVNQVIVARWNDNSVVTLASNCQPVNPTRTTKRDFRKEKKIINVPEASLVRYYKKNMSEIDRMDQNISYYLITVLSKKWWMPFFMLMIDAAVQNTCLLY